MVFPRNAGLGRCYLLSTRHEILSNIDWNLTGTRLRLWKKPKWNKSRESANPSFIAVIWVSNSSLPAFRLSPKNVSEVHDTKVLLSQSDVPTFNLTMASCWRFTKRTIGPGNWAGTNPHRFPPSYRIGTIFHNKYIFSNKNAFQVEIWKMLDSPCLISTTKWKLTWWNNPAICKASSEENGTGQYPEPHGKGTIGPELKSTKISWNFQF